MADDPAEAAPIAQEESEVEEPNVPSKVWLHRRLYRFVKCYWRSLVIVISPLVLLPIPLSAHNDFTKLIYVICLMFVWWVGEVIPIAITALMPLVLFPLMGILSSYKCCGQFISHTSITFLGTFIMGQALEYCLLDQRIALKILRKVGCRPILLHNLLICTAFLSSMWVLDMAVVAIMCPIVKAILRELDIHGLCKQFEDVKDEGHNRPSGTALCFYLGVSFAAIFGGCSTLIGTGANLVMVEMYQILFKKQISFAAFSIYAFPVMLFMVIFSTMFLQWRFLGLFNKDRSIDCLLTKEALEETRQSVEEEYQRLVPFVFHEKCCIVLLILLVFFLMTRKPGLETGWNYLLFDGNVTEATVSTAVFIMLIALPSHLSFLNYFKKDARFLPLRRSRGAISWAYVRQRVPWRIIFLIGGGLILAEGSRVTQMSYHISNIIIKMHHFPKLLLSFVLCFPVFLLTQVIGNTPLAYMSLPIIVDLAACHEIHPTYFMIPVTIICSLALTTPVGTGANAIVVGFANIRSVDVAVIGALPALLSFFLIWLSFPLYGELLFPEMSEFVFNINGTSCEEHLIVK